MANSNLLQKKWKQSGKKKSYLAKQLQISRPRLDHIFANPITATVYQADTLSKELSISSSEITDIFLPEK